MTVKELIEELQKYDPTDEVYVGAPDGIGPIEVIEHSSRTVELVAFVEEGQC